VGVFRIILAIAVMFDHMQTSSGETLNLIFGSLTAVRVFFMISGFYMSLIFINKYSRHENGHMLFYSNRALRIYPTYIAVLIFATVLTEIQGGHSLLLSAENWASPEFYIPISNILILGLDILITHGIVPIIGPAWSIGSELAFYLLVPFIILKRPFVVGILIAGSIIVRIWLNTNGYPAVPWTYNFFPSILVFFLLGHISYLIYNQIKKFAISRYLAISGIIVFLVYITYKAYAYGNFFLPFLDPTVNTGQGFAFYVTFTLFMPFLFLATKDSKIDRFIGNLSFSTYLLATPTRQLIDTNQNIFGTENIHLVTLIMTLTLSLNIYLAIEKPIEAIRVRRLKGMKS
jgi:peptidoglycan/LPS O-acetylase OafA/YrhL